MMIRLNVYTYPWLTNFYHNLSINLYFICIYSFHLYLFHLLVLYRRRRNIWLSWKEDRERLIRMYYTSRSVQFLLQLLY